MKIAKRTGSGSVLRLVRPLLWAVGIAGVVAWAGCGGSTGTSSSSGTFVCSCGSSCSNCPPGLPSPGSPCPQPGLCCSYGVCNHMGGINGTDAVCSDVDGGADGGTWTWH
jgi:hypothetical protein